MSAIGLMFVGVTLFINGLSGKLNIASQSVAAINILTGLLSFFIHLIYMLNGDYYIAGSGFMFAFTYLLIGISYALSLDLKVYGLFALFVAINTIPFSVVTLLVDGDPIFALIWLLWGLLWLSGFIQYVLGVNLSKYIDAGAIFCGIFTTWIPGVIMLLGFWPY